MASLLRKRENIRSSSPVLRELAGGTGERVRERSAGGWEMQVAISSEEICNRASLEATACSSLGGVGEPSGGDRRALAIKGLDGAGVGRGTQGGKSGGTFGKSSCSPVFGFTMLTESAGELAFGSVLASKR